MKNDQLRQHLKITWRHKLRRFRLRRILRHLGQDVFIDKNVELQRYPQNISLQDQVVVKEGVRICSCNKTAVVDIGKNTTIGFHTFMFSSNAIRIGNNCLIAPFVYIVDSDHEIEKGTLINEQPNITSPITVGNDVWIGDRAIIHDGVRIGDGAIIATGAIVHKDVPPYAIVAGNPMKILQFRFDDIKISELLNIKWWDKSDEDIQENVKRIILEDSSPW